MFFFFCLTVLTYIVIIIRLYKYETAYHFVLHGLDLFTITVEPTLPIALTIGIIYAVEKLKEKEIYTISPNQVVEGGVLDIMCFDKTGTLTSDTMDFRTLVLMGKDGF